MLKVRNKRVLMLAIFMALIAIMIYTLFGHRSNSICAGAAFVIILVDYIVVTKVLIVNNTVLESVFNSRFLSVLPAGALLWLMISLNDSYCRYQLANFKIYTYGKVVEVPIIQGRRGLIFNAEIQYSVNNHIYTHTVANDDHFFKYGDRVTIACSKNDPEIMEITAVKPGLDIYHGND